MKNFKKFVVGILLASFFVQPLGWFEVACAETVEMEYPAPTDPAPKHIHAPKIVDGVEYQYDANGNLTYDGERRVTWNQDNKPIRIEKDGQVVEFFYDANGRRIVKKSGGTKTTYPSPYLKIQQPASPAGRFNNETIYQTYYFANGRRVVARHASPTSGAEHALQLHSDHLGSTVLATDSNSQKLTEPLSYFPYGSFVNRFEESPLADNLTMEQFNNYLFTGQELDPESALYNCNARLYDPTTGAFISADPVQGPNRYAYAKNSPIRFTDPTGLHIPEEILAEMQQREDLVQGEELGLMDFALFMKEHFGVVGVTAELWEAVRPEAEKLFGVNVAEAITRSVVSSENLQCVGFARACLRAMGSDLPPLGLEVGALGRPLEGLVWRGAEDIQPVEVGDIFVYQRRVGDEVREHWAVVSGKTGESVTLVEAVGSSFRYGDVYAPAGGIMVGERTVDLSTGEIFGMGSEVVVGYGFYRPEK